MNHLWTIASLTVKEAIRRRAYIGSILIAFLFVAWSLLPINPHAGFITGSDPQTAADNTGKIFAWLGCGTIKFFSSVLAITLAAGAITAEVEKGVLSVIIPKPLSRLTIYLGKWLGLIIFLAASVALWAALLVFAIWHRTGTFHPHVLLGILATCLFPLLFVTLTLCFSTFASNALSAGLAFIAAGIALAQDMLYSLSVFLQNDILSTLSNIVGYIVPLGKMNHWITKGLGDAGMDLSALNPIGRANVVTSTSDLIYILAYIAVALGLGYWVFQKRDL